MAVFTEVSFNEASVFLNQLNLGQLRHMEGCSGGIENTNFFINTDQGEYVLTLFERLTAQQLSFYLRLMKHLAHAGIPVPDPEADRDGNIVHSLNGKPAAVVNRLIGHSVLTPQAEHCAAVGQMMAKMHLAGRDFERQQPNLRGLSWWNETIPVVLPYLQAEQAQLIGRELAYQNHVAASSAYAALPRGAIHADLFRDNVMFESRGSSPELTGFFDFYFAGIDSWLFDLAVSLNDWAIDLSTGAHDPVRAASFLQAYNAVRPLSAAERHMLPAMLRAGALRFWTSRLWDCHLPRDATMLQAHDPSHFERVLLQRADHPVLASDLL